jgi:PadR family transcriptional regulator PadR
MRAEHLKGHLDGLLLAVLEGDPLHGYAIIEALRARSGGALDLPGGTVYPALRRLELAGVVEGVWSEVAGRRRRTYRLTDRGRAALAEERSTWHGFARVVGSVLGQPAS